MPVTAFMHQQIHFLPMYGCHPSCFRRSRWLSGRTRDCGARGPRFESHRSRSCLSRSSVHHCDIQPWVRQGRLSPLHYITLHYKTIYSGQSKKNCKVQYGASHTTMSGYDCRNKCVFSFRRNDNSDVAVVTSRLRVFQILGPAVANKRSPTVTRRDGRISRRLVDDDRRRVLAGMSAM